MGSNSCFDNYLLYGSTCTFLACCTHFDPYTCIAAVFTKKKRIKIEKKENHTKAVSDAAFLLVKFLARIFLLSIYHQLLLAVLSFIAFQFKQVLIAKCLRKKQKNAFYNH